MSILNAVILLEESVEMCQDFPLVCMEFLKNILKLNWYLNLSFITLLLNFESE